MECSKKYLKPNGTFSRIGNNENFHNIFSISKYLRFVDLSKQQSSKFDTHKQSKNTQKGFT